MAFPDLAIIIPTLNEQGNVAELVRRLVVCLDGLRWEVIFVDDDSSDGTRAAIAELAAADSRVRLLHRVGRRGLSSACIEGMLSSLAPVLAVMDADLQHDEALLPDMFEVLRQDQADLVIGSRYVDGGSVGGWRRDRRRISSIATVLSQKLLKVEVADPMSGFFMLKRGVLEQALPCLSGKGFKILLDILASAHEPVRVRELPFVFRNRVSGESKLDSMVIYEYGLLLYEKLFGHVVPVRFLMFVSVGAIGAVLHLAVLGAALNLAGAAFVTGQTLAAVAAMVLNFSLNNLFTHRDLRLRGVRLAGGLFRFMAVCAVGAVASVGIGSLLNGHGVPWWMAGLMGATFGAVWNYAVTTILVWKR